MTPAVQQEAVPAKQLGLSGRGVIAVGMAYDGSRVVVRHGRVLR